MIKETFSKIYLPLFLVGLIGVTLTLVGFNNLAKIVQATSHQDTPLTVSASNTGTTYYVKAAAPQEPGENPDNGHGTLEQPFRTLKRVEQKSEPGDTIIVLYSPIALDGGLTLKDGQVLQGQKGPGGALPTITNSSAALNAGVGVTLAADNMVKNLHILDTYLNGILGGNVGSLTIQGNTVTGYNTSKTITPVLSGRPLLGDKPGIHIVTTGSSKSTIVLKNNIVSDSEGRGIHVNGIDTSIVEVISEGNIVQNNGHVAGATVSSGIGVIPLFSSEIIWNSKNDSVFNIGTSSPRSNSDGMLAGAFFAGKLQATISGYSYVNPDGDGNSSATGITAFTILGNGANVEIVIEDSTFVGGRTDAIFVVASRGTGPSSLIVDIRNNRIEEAGNRGIRVLDFLSPGTSLEATIVGNMVIDSPVGIEATASSASSALFNVKMEENTLEGNGVGLEFRNIASTGSQIFDAGSGALGSLGENRIINSIDTDISVDGFDVTAENNWWGSKKGPSTVLELNGGTVDYVPFLKKDPSP